MLTQAEKDELIRLKKLLLQIESARLHAIRAREGAREYSDAAKAAAAAAVGTKRNREDDSGSESESESGPDEEELNLRRQIRELEQKLTDAEYEEFLREEGAAQYFPAARAFTMSNAKRQNTATNGGNYKLKRNSKTKRRNGKTKRRSGKTKRRSGKTKRTRRIR